MRVLAALDLRPLAFFFAGAALVGGILWASGHTWTFSLRATAFEGALVATTGLILSTARTWARCKLEAASLAEPEDQGSS